VSVVVQSVAFELVALTVVPHSNRVGGLRETLFGTEASVHRTLVAAGAVAVIAGVVLRFWAPSPLWLDETISVNIARLPLADIPRALSHDGAPPLYYVLLHFWMLAFGTGDFAVRAFSGVVSVAALPLFWVAGRRVGGRTVAWVTFFLGVTSPFAINYATAARMYSMMILLSVLGYLALQRALEQPSRGRLAALAVVTAALLYTHYWGLYLVLVTAAWMVWRARRAPFGSGPLALRAIGFGALAWLPWAPVFAYQAMHTGTPWTSAASPGDLLGLFGDYSGPGSWGMLLMFGTFALFLIGVFGRTAVPGTLVSVTDADGEVREVPSGPAVVIEMRPRPGMAPLVLMALGTLAIAVVLGAVAHAAFVARYTAVVLPLFLLVVAAGIAVIPGRRFRIGCIAVLCVAGLLTGYGENKQHRTQAQHVAAVLNAQAQTGDVVVYCPDQLGPAVDRLLTVPGVIQVTFPRALGPQRVDWVDYRTVITHTDVETFAQEALSRLGSDHTLWLVWRDGYPGLGGDCGYLKSWFDLLRSPGPTVVKQNGNVYYEYENLIRYSS
jgi:mannosyltransferase